MFDFVALVEKIIAGRFRTALVHCTNTDKDLEGDVITFSSKRIVVVIGEDPALRIELTRTDLTKPYVGRQAGLEFTVHAADID